MGYQENPDHVPDPTAVSGTLDTSGIYGGGAHESIRGTTEVFNVADRLSAPSEPDESIADTPDDEVVVDASREPDLAGPVADPAEQENPSPFPEGTLDVSDVLTDEEIAQRSDPDRPDPLAAEFDPSEHTVAEVNTYLGSASEDERARVLAAEQADRNRKGITGE